jgi:hypothetical protein
LREFRDLRRSFVDTLATGTPADVLTPALIARAFDVPPELARDLARLPAASAG